MSSWFLFSILSITVLSASELFQQYVLNRKKLLSPLASTVLVFLVQALFTTPLMFYYKKFNEISTLFLPNIWPLFLLMGISSSFGILYYFKSLDAKTISFSSIFVSFSSVVSTFLGVIFLNETLYLTKIFGIFLILFSIFLVNSSDLKLEKNNYYGLLSGIFLGITVSIDSYLLDYFDTLTYIWLAFPMVSLFAFIRYPRTLYSEIKTFGKSEIIPVIFSGIGYLLYNIFVFLSYKYGGEVGRVDAINNSQVFLIILFEFFILKNKEDLLIKIVSSTLAVFGIFLLGFY